MSETLRTKSINDNINAAAFGLTKIIEEPLNIQND